MLADEQTLLTVLIWEIVWLSRWLRRGTDDMISWSACARSQMPSFTFLLSSFCPCWLALLNSTWRIKLFQGQHVHMHTLLPIVAGSVQLLFSTLFFSPWLNPSILPQWLYDSANVLMWRNEIIRYLFMPPDWPTVTFSLSSIRGSRQFQRT